MNSKELLESIMVEEQDTVNDVFINLMAEKLSDALEVRKVELASEIMIDESAEFEKTAKKYAKAEKEDAEKEYSYGTKIKNTKQENKRTADMKASFLKRFATEEVEQIDEASYRDNQIASREANENEREYQRKTTAKK